MDFPSFFPLVVLYVLAKCHYLYFLDTVKNVSKFESIFLICVRNYRYLWLSIIWLLLLKSIVGWIDILGYWLLLLLLIFGLNVDIIEANLNVELAVNWRRIEVSWEVFEGATSNSQIGLISTLWCNEFLYNNKDKVVIDKSLLFFLKILFLELLQDIFLLNWQARILLLINCWYRLIKFGLLLIVV